MPLMHAWHEFTVSITVLLEALAFATIHEQPFPFPHCCGCDLTAPTKGLSRTLIFQHDSTLLTQRPDSDSFSNSVHWVLTCRLNGTSACFKPRTNTAQKQYKYTKTKHYKQTKRKQYGRKTAV